MLICVLYYAGNLDDVLDVAVLPRRAPVSVPAGEDSVSAVPGPSYALAVINNSPSLRILDPQHRVLQRMDAHSDVILALDTSVDW